MIGIYDQIIPGTEWLSFWMYESYTANTMILGWSENGMGTSKLQLYLGKRMTNYQNLGCPIFTQTRTESPFLEEVGVVPKQPSTGGLPDGLPACRPLLKNSAKIKRGAGSANPLGSVRLKGAWSKRAVANLAAVEDRMTLASRATRSPPVTLESSIRTVKTRVEMLC